MLQVANLAQFPTTFRFGGFSLPNIGDIVPWNTHFTVAEEASLNGGGHHIAKALYYLGVYDFRLHEIFPDLTLARLKSMDYPCIASNLTAGEPAPFELANDNIVHLGEALVDHHGRYHGMSAVHYEPGTYDTYAWTAFFLAPFIENELNTSPVTDGVSEAEKLLIFDQLDDFLRRSNSDVLELLRHRFIGIEYLVKAPNTILYLNKYFIFDNHQAPEIMQAYFDNLRSTSLADYRSSAAAFFLTLDERRGLQSIFSEDNSLAWLQMVVSGLPEALTASKRMDIANRIGFDTVRDKGPEWSGYEPFLNDCRKLIAQAINGYPITPPGSWSELIRRSRRRAVQSLSISEHFLALEMTKLLESIGAPTPAQIAQLLPLIGDLFETEAYQVQFLPVFRDITEKADLGKTLNQRSLRWRALYNARVLSPQNATQRLSAIIEDIKQVSNPRLVQGYCETLLFEGGHSGKVSEFSLVRRILDPSLWTAPLGL